MIKDKKLWEEWQKQYARKESLDLIRNLHLLEAMYEEVRSLKVLPLSNPLEGLETKIQMAKVLNVSKAA